MLTDADRHLLAAVEARLNATTGGGDWRHCKGAAGDHYCVCGQVSSVSADAYVHTPVEDFYNEGIPMPDKAGQAANSVFIAHAPDDLRLLLALVKRLDEASAGD